VKIFHDALRLPDFDRDMKRLLKRFKTREDDLRIFIEKELYLYHKLKIDNKGVFALTGLDIAVPRVFKAKKFACRSLVGKGVHSGIRVIFSYYAEEDKVELIEIYFKGDKENEGRQRILK
jgi:hypothetical protein